MQYGPNSGPAGRPPRWLFYARLIAVLAVAAVIAASIVLLQRRRPSTIALHQAAPAPTTGTAAENGTIATAGSAGGSLGALASGVPERGQPAPDFALLDLNGNRVQLTGLRGKVVVVNFWATWCGPCRQEFPELQKAATDLGQDVVVLALDQAESAGRVTQFRDEFGATFTILLDSANAVADSYKFNGIPDTVFIDRKGVVQDVVRGPLSAGSFRYKIKQMLNTQ